MSNTILSTEERDRLVYLIDLMNDLNVTQLDHDETAEMGRLLKKLREEQ